jgi:RNA-directed DNA polymerase
LRLRRHTIGKRMRGKLIDIKQQLRQRMHDPVAETGKWLKSVVQGYFNYHAVPGNTDCLRVFRWRVTRLWRQVLIRSGQRGYLNWARMRRLEERWVPSPRVLILTPEFALTPFIQNKSPMRYVVAKILDTGRASPV